MYNSNVDKIFTFDQNERNRYGNTAFGNACITARNLIRADMGTRFHSDFDRQLGPSHQHLRPQRAAHPAGQAIRRRPRHADRRPQADGSFDQTLIVAQGEFGRTTGPPNSNAGRDHFLQQTALFAGAGIQGGRAIGKTDTLRLRHPRTRLGR
jgi:hypothetical protein